MQKKTTLSEQFQNPNTKVADAGKIDFSCTRIHDRSLCSLDTDI